MRKERFNSNSNKYLLNTKKGQRCDGFMSGRHEDTIREVLAILVNLCFEKTQKMTSKKAYSSSLNSGSSVVYPLEIYRTQSVASVTLTRFQFELQFRFHFFIRSDKYHRHRQTRSLLEKSRPDRIIGKIPLAKNNRHSLNYEQGPDTRTPVSVSNTQILLG